MFGKNKSQNNFFSRMTNYIARAMENSSHHAACAEEIQPMLKAFLKKVMSADVDWNSAKNVCWNIESITKAVQYLAENTRNYQKMSDEDLEAFKKIFEEIYALYDETLKKKDQGENITNKISCISEIANKNKVGMHDSPISHEDWRDGMIFRNYENLWKVIHRVNTEWDELCSRGFSVNVFYEFWEAFKYDKASSKERPKEGMTKKEMAEKKMSEKKMSEEEKGEFIRALLDDDMKFVYEFWEAFKCEKVSSEEMSGKEMTEEEKIEFFMALLDGKMKFVPVYQHEYKFLGFKVVDQKDDDEIVYISNKKSESSWCMRQAEGEEKAGETTEE